MEDLRIMIDMVSSLRRSKAKKINTLNPNLSKSFWTAIHYAKKKQSSIPTLVSNNQKFESDEEKAQVLNYQFFTNFNCSLPPLNPINFSVPRSLLCPNELLCTEIEVSNLISSIHMTKSNGPDGIAAKMLKATVGSITPAVTKSIKSGKLPNEWKPALVTPIPKPGNYRPISLLSIYS